MDKLIIKKGNRIFFGDNEIMRNSVNFTEFLIANLETEVELEEGLTIEELVHVFYDCKAFVYSYFSEQYEVLRALVTIKDLSKHYSYIKIFKKAHFDDNYLYIQPCVDFIIVDDQSSKSNVLGQVCVKLDEEINVVEDDFFEILNDQGRTVKGGYKMKITLLDIMRALFDDLSSLIQEEMIHL